MFPRRQIFLLMLLALFAWWMGANWNGASKTETVNSSPAAGRHSQDSVSATRRPALPVAGSPPAAVSAGPSAPGRQAVASERAIENFSDWTRRYLAATPDQRDGLEAGGVALALARRPLFKQLIQDDPRRAYELAVPRVVRQELPPAIIAQLEKPVSATGEIGRAHV